VSTRDIKNTFRIFDEELKKRRNSSVGVDFELNNILFIFLYLTINI
jgi:hypothetical protein